MADKLPFEAELSEEETLRASTRARAAVLGRRTPGDETDEELRAAEIASGVVLHHPEEQNAHAVISISPELDPRVLALAAETASILAWANNLEIKAQEDNKVATENLVFIQGLTKSLEDHRKEYTAPLNDWLKEFNAQFKTFSGPLQEATDTIKAKMIAYKRAEDEKRRQQEELERQRQALQVQEMVVEGELTTDLAPVEIQAPAPSMVRTEAGAAVGGKKWTWEVEDFALIPDDYKVTANQIILKAIQAGKTIPGIKATQEDTISVRPR